MMVCYTLESLAIDATCESHKPSYDTVMVLRPAFSASPRCEMDTCSPRRRWTGSTGTLTHGIHCEQQRAPLLFARNINKRSSQL